MPVDSLIPAPVLRLIEAINTEDTAQFLICFTEDAVVDAQGRTFTGPDAISAWNEAENIGLHTRVEVVGAHTDQDCDVLLEVDLTGDAFAGLVRFAFDIEGKLVRRMTIRREQLSLR